MSTTATNYLNNINEGFPVKGQDNDSQGFRDNFLNIKRSLDTINEQVDDLEKYSIKTNSTATFLGNTIEDANLKNCTTELYNYEELQTEKIYIDYTLGSYQKFDLSPGIHDIDIENWPGLGKSGKINLSITTVSDVYTAIRFPTGYINLNPQTNPFELTSDKPNIFEIWSEDGVDFFVKYITTFTYSTGTTTSTLWTTVLKLGVLNSSTSNSYYTNQPNYNGSNGNASTNTSIISKATVVRRESESAHLALVPNRITKTLIHARSEVDPPLVTLTLSDINGIEDGAQLYTTVTNSVYTVTSVITTSSQVTISPYLDAGGFGTNFGSSTSTRQIYLTFTNPTFVEQPTIMTLSATAANTATGSKTNYEGSIYADKHRLEVTYDQFGNNTTNTFVVTTPQDSRNVANTGTDLANVQFVHSVMPFGAIIMWYGLAERVPEGWAICKGGTTTTSWGQVIDLPNLTDKFIIAANPASAVPNPDYEPEIDSFTKQIRLPGTSITGTNANTGGQANIELIQHTHTATFAGSVLPDHVHSITDLEHQHISPTADCGTAVFGLDTGVSTDKFCDSDGVGPAGWYTSAVKTGIDGTNGIDGTALTPAGSVTVYNTGTNNGQYKNIPPFIAVYYIMKISGQHIVPTFS